MHDERARRLQKLVGLREDAVSQAEAALSTAKRMRIEAEVARRAAIARWNEAAEIACASEWTSVEDHEIRRRHVVALRRDVEQLAAAATMRACDEDAALAALIQARQELKKVETWRESMVAAARAEGERVERLAADEQGLRRVRTA